MSIVKIIQFCADNITGTPGYSCDVEVKYLIEEEKVPYWIIDIKDYIIDFETLVRLNEVAFECDFKIQLCKSGIYCIPIIR